MAQRVTFSAVRQEFKLSDGTTVFVADRDLCSLCLREGIEQHTQTLVNGIPMCHPHVVDFVKDDAFLAAELEKIPAKPPLTLTEWAFALAGSPGASTS
jgi:hypothetical protein